MLTVVFFLFFGPPSRTPGKEEFHSYRAVFYLVVRFHRHLCSLAYEQFFLARSDWILVLNPEVLPLMAMQN
jgi:hypothetical protein